jgi:hypothetical protein
LQDSLDFPEFRIVFVREKLWTKSTSRGPQAPSVHHGPAPWPTSGAHWSSASGHSRAQDRRGRGGGGGGGSSEHICGLLGAREVGKRWRGGEGLPAAVGAQWGCVPMWERRREGR